MSKWPPAGTIMDATPFGKARKPKRKCPRCLDEGDHIDWSRRLWQGPGEELGLVAPCECAKTHRGRWLKRDFKTGQRIIHARGEHLWDDLRNSGIVPQYESSPVNTQPQPLWKHEYVFPLPENPCDCKFCVTYFSME